MNQTKVQMTLTMLDGERTIQASALIDSSCTMSCINKEFIRRTELPPRRCLI